MAMLNNQMVSRISWTNRTWHPETFHVVKAISQLATFHQREIASGYVKIAIEHVHL